MNQNEDTRAAGRTIAASVAVWALFMGLLLAPGPTLAILGAALALLILWVALRGIIRGVRRHARAHPWALPLRLAAGVVALIGTVTIAAVGSVLTDPAGMPVATRIVLGAIFLALGLRGLWAVLAGFRRACGHDDDIARRLRGAHTLNSRVSLRESFGPVSVTGPFSCRRTIMAEQVQLAVSWL